MSIYSSSSDSSSASFSDKLMIFSLWLVSSMEDELTSIKKFSQKNFHFPCFQDMLPRLRRLIGLQYRRLVNELSLFKIVKLWKCSWLLPHEQAICFGSLIWLSRNKSVQKSRFSRIVKKRDFSTDLFRESQIRLLKQMACLWGNNHGHFHNSTILKSESSLANLLCCRPISLLNLGNIYWTQGKWKFFDWGQLCLNTLS